MSSEEQQQQQSNNGLVTVRVVKSLEYRNIKNLVLRDIDLNMKVSEFKEYVKNNEDRLTDCGVINETEISFFNLEDYNNFKANPKERKIEDESSINDVYKNGAGGIIPFVKDVYPPDQVDPNVPLFCFPEEIDNKAFMNQTYTPSKSSESFSFVLTDREGNQQFGFTRRIVTAVPTLGRIPESLCIISKHAWFSTFIAILEILEVRYRASMEEIHNFLAAALLSAIPAPGDTFTVYIYNNPFISASSSSSSSTSTTTSPSATTITGTRDRSLSTPNLTISTGGAGDPHHQSDKSSQPLPVSYQLKRPLATDKSSLHDGTLLPLIESLTSQKILSLFISLLFERRIIIYSENISRVSKFVNAAVSMIDPFVWQHIFIPILPRSLLDYVTAPMPFIIGIHSSLFPLIRKKPLSEIIYVDLDKDHVLPLPEDIALFPPQLLQPLKVCLDLQIADFKKNKHYDNKVIVDTFRKFFVTIMGTYRRFFLKDLDKRKSIFDKASFIDSQIINPAKFFTTFCSSQMFERFIAEREEYFFKGITPPGSFEKEVILYDLKHPVTASINNTLKNKEKEKEKEREKERLEKERAKSVAKANAYKTVLDPKRLSVLNPPKSNGLSVDRSFLSSLIGTNNNSSATVGSLTVVNTSTPSTSPSLPRAASPTMTRSTTMGSISSKAQTMTALEVGSLAPLTDVQLPIPAHIQQQQQQQKLQQQQQLLQQQQTSEQQGGVSLPKPKSHTNLASLASNIVQNAASITKSTSASFTLGHGQSLLPPNPTLPSGNQSLSSATHTGGSHSRTLSDVGNIILSVTKKSTQILSSGTTQPTKPIASDQTLNSNNVNTAATSNVIPPTTTAAANTTTTNNTVQIIQTHPNSPTRMGIGHRSLPFTLIHQKFSPNDPTRMTIEDIFNLFYPGQKPSNGTTTPVVTPHQPVTSTSGMKKSTSQEKNIFKIPELPDNISIPLSINKTNKNQFMTQASGSAGNINTQHATNTNSGIQLTASAPANPTIISSSYAVSDKSTLPPPPISAHSILHRRTHQRSVSEKELLEAEKEQLLLQQQQIQQVQQVQVQQQPMVVAAGGGGIQQPQPSLRLSSSSVPKPITTSSQLEQQQQQQQHLQPIVENVLQQQQQQQEHNGLPPLTSTVQLPIPVANVDHNPLPPLNTGAPVVVDLNTSGSSLIHRSGGTPMMCRTMSSNNFFDNNPLSTNIETSPAVVLASSTASCSSSNSNFFNECSLLGVPSSLPHIAGSTPLSTATSSVAALSSTSSLNSSYGSFTSAVLNNSNILSASGMMMMPPSAAMISAAAAAQQGQQQQHTQPQQQQQPQQPQQQQVSVPVSSTPVVPVSAAVASGGGVPSQQQQQQQQQQPNNNHSNASSFSSNQNVVTSSTSNVLPPLIPHGGSTTSLLPPPASLHSNHFFDQSPLSQSSFVDFGPPAPSLPGLNNNSNGPYNQMLASSTPPTYTQPQQVQPQQQPPVQQGENVSLEREMVKANIKECLKNEDTAIPLELDLNSLKLNKFPSELKKEIYRDKKKLVKAMIKKLDVSINKLNDFKWDLSSSFDQLDYLNLSGNPLSSLMTIGLPGSVYLKTITKIDVCGCKLLRVGQNDLRQLTNLAQLNLSNNEIGEIHPEALSCLAQLEDLNVSGNSSLKAIPEAVLKCRQITHLDVSGCSINELPHDLSPLAKMLELNLGNNNISEIPDSISLLVFLCRINLQDNNIRNLPLSIGKCRGIVSQMNGIILHGNPLDAEIKQLYNENPAKLAAYLERRYQLQGGDTLNFKLAAQYKHQQQQPAAATPTKSSPPLYPQSPPNTGYPIATTTSTTTSSNQANSAASSLQSNTPTTSVLSTSNGSSMASSPRSYKLSVSNEAWRELPNHIPGPKHNLGGGGSSASSSPISSSPMTNPLRLSQQYQQQQPPPSPLHHSAGGIRTQFQFSDSPSSSPSTPSPLSSSPQFMTQQQQQHPEDPTVTMMKENIYGMIKNEFRQNITSIYEKVNKSSNVKELIQFATIVRSIQSELDDIGKILAYKKIYLPNIEKNIGSNASETEKFNQLKQLVKSKIEICVIYSKHTIEHVDIQHSMSDLSFVYRVIKSLSNKLTL
ncbi:putative guanine nucleotide exchange factor [Cavenderia fasciculata]|uniref:Guanine nucleotide exchange factor n=1 Tax=Cavenderia fasciculata TaxID=261658 RepID=F4PVT1_CACFS|nr:putative guanine nucleotide exchange factor [Cavenderia fasciculata]EGG20095.1 putative guanine nucleotide exchange factor [Cavenderia fasciculata]|eukprot:XP_004367078.1 putative guanine nucleotide exchange factor [Cavenderia fasciculata]